MSLLSYDVIVAGAGSSGCALAARLSATRRVLLIDAGPHFRRLEDFPQELARVDTIGAMFPGHPNNWSFVGQLRPGRPYPMPRGKVVGGSSAINGAVFVRGRKEDFAEWVAQGNSEWSYDRVLPFYIRSETDLDFSDDYHGRSGPIPVRRSSSEQMHPVSTAFTNACLKLGYPYEPDKNGLGPEGVGPIPSNCIDGIRMNASITYLGLCDGSENLTILPNTVVRKVLFNGYQTIGVEVDSGGERQSLFADQVVLSAGTLKTPQLLMLSGIGPAAGLRAHNIDVLADLPGVGQGVGDHPSISVRYRLEGVPPRTTPGMIPMQATLNYVDSAFEDDGDLQIICTTGTLNRLMRRSSSTGFRNRLPSYVSRPVATLQALRKLPARFLLSQARAGADYHLLCTVEREKSRGSIGIRSSDPAESPAIDLNYLSDSGDFARLRSVIRVAAAALETAPFRELGARRIAPTDAELASDSVLDRWIEENLTSSFHTSSSARMGPASDTGSVVDQYFRVHGVTGLRVVDLSALPNILRRATNATAIMLAERAAAFMQ